MAIEVVVAYDTPGLGPAGLAWDGQSLWLADYREGFIYQLDAAAQIRGQIWCPGNLGGLTWDGQHLWQVVFDEGVVRSINPQSTDFDQTIDLSGSGWLSGVAWDGLNLRVVAQQSGDILTVARESGAVLSRLAGPVAIGDIDCVADTLWLSVATPMTYSAEHGFRWLADEPAYALLQLDATTGRELARHLVEHLYTGLAWAGDELWLAAAGAGRLYRARVVPD